MGVLSRRSRGPERTGPPDFVGVGSQGTATQWWHRLLLQHPAIRKPDGRRELHFFDRLCTREMTDEDVAEYHARFPRRPGELTGEWTPRYMYDPWTPVLLQRAAPDAKLIAMVGDPIERYRLRLQEERGEDVSEQVFMTDAVERGRYATQLKHLRAFFPAERILVLQHERCRRDPVGEYRRTLRFLGLDEASVPKPVLIAGGQAEHWYAPIARTLRLHRIARRDRPPAERPERERVELWPDIVASLREELEPEVRELQELVPELDLSLWRNFAPAPVPA
ncbi:MAG TPA: sulfotransferase domain-containing protein [Capillimicrobium sp.]|nr:sulfotransferase domain-containing protein [Capillimicrobium sp.]